MNKKAEQGQEQNKLKARGRVNRKDGKMNEDGTRILERDKENKTHKIESEEEY